MNLPLTFCIIFCVSRRNSMPSAGHLTFLEVSSPLRGRLVSSRFPAWPLHGPRGNGMAMEPGMLVRLRPSSTAACLATKENKSARSYSERSRDEMPTGFWTVQARSDDFRPQNVSGRSVRKSSVKSRDRYNRYLTNFANSVNENMTALDTPDSIDCALADHHSFLFLEGAELSDGSYM